MKLRYIMLSLWVAVAVYSTFSYLYGPTGLASMKRLELQKARLEKNVEELEQIRQNLTYSVNSLLYDRETLEVLARDLGYGKPGEYFIRISGADSVFKNRVVVGGLVRSENSEAMLGESQLRIIAFSSGLITLFFCLLFSTGSKRARKKRL